MEFLCEYNFEVKFFQGKENVVAVTLSWQRHGLFVVTLGVDLRSHILATLPTDRLY